MNMAAQMRSVSRDAGEVIAASRRNLDAVVARVRVEVRDEQGRSLPPVLMSAGRTGAF